MKYINSQRPVTWMFVDTIQNPADIGEDIGEVEDLILKTYQENGGMVEGG